MDKRSLFRLTLFGMFLMTLVILLGRTPAPGYASSLANFSLGKTVISEGNDFATRVLAQPWNMNGAPYPDYWTALKNFNENEFQVTSNGRWSLETINSDPIIWLHWTGVGTTQRVLKMGDTYPIDASKYRLLSFYMCLDQAPSQVPMQDDDWAAIVYWMYDRSPHDDPANGVSNYLLFKQQGFFQNPGDCELLTFDLSRPEAWSEGAWSNSPRMPMGIRLDPINKPGKTFRIDWVRLTTVDTSNTVPLTWSNAPAGNIEFYATQAACGQDGVLIGRVNNAPSSGTFQWGAQLQAGWSPAQPLPIPESFEPGSYTIFMKDAAGGIACAASPLTVHAAPMIEFQRPSFYSGPDYGSTVVGDAWGMANPEDIESISGTTPPTYANGILDSVSLSTDPRLFMNLTSPIDASKYRFATFRMRVSAENHELDALVQRFVWWYAGANDSVTTQDMEIYDGWHTYTIDLKTAGTENCTSNCWSGFPNSLRFDPHEEPNSRYWIDFMTLTGYDTVVRGSTANIHYTLPNAPNAEVTFYYDTDKNPSNGRTPLLEFDAHNTPADDPLLAFKLFLPVTTRPGEVDFFLDSLTFVWDTAPVPINTYYISADVDDGFMVTTWYADAPVIIK